MIDHSQLHTCQSATQQTLQETTFDHDRRPVSRWWRRKNCFRFRFYVTHVYTGVYFAPVHVPWTSIRRTWSTRRTAASTPQTLLVASICRMAGNTLPQYTTDCCVHTSDIARRQHLRSAGCHQLFVPRHRRSMFSRRAFSVAGPAACNSLPDYLRDPSRSADSFLTRT